jgi:hypothetical protein
MRQREAITARRAVSCTNASRTRAALASFGCYMTCGQPLSSQVRIDLDGGRRRQMPALWPAGDQTSTPDDLERDRWMAAAGSRRKFASIPVPRPKRRTPILGIGKPATCASRHRWRSLQGGLRSDPEFDLTLWLARRTAFQAARAHTGILSRAFALQFRRLPVTRTFQPGQSQCDV